MVSVAPSSITSPVLTAITGASLAGVIAIVNVPDTSPPLPSLTVKEKESEVVSLPPWV